MKVPEPRLGEDTVAWSLSLKRDFSIKSTYGIILSFGDNGNRNLFQAIWKLEAAQRLKSFLWLAANDALLTNANKVRRNLTSQVDCAIYGEKEETMLHILRECPLAKSIWKSIDFRLV